MAGYGTSRPAPDLKTAFAEPIVYEHGKGNSKGLERIKSSLKNVKVGK